LHFEVIGLIGGNQYFRDWAALNTEKEKYRNQKNKTLVGPMREQFRMVYGCPVFSRGYIHDRLPSTHEIHVGGWEIWRCLF
jgi:hypothetical protein